MHSLFELFPQLPQELKKASVEHLSTLDLVRCTQTSKYHQTLFQPLLSVRQFLHSVTRGKHEAVKTMLQKNPYLMIQRSQVTDCSERVFLQISGFEYALWALDKQLWTAMITCIPDTEPANPLFTQLLALYHHVQQHGVTYNMEGKTITESHFNWKGTLIKELQTQVDLINASGDEDWQAINKQWREGVGGAQKCLPIHLVDEYCSIELVSTSHPTSSKLLFNWKTQQYEPWFDSTLGIEFAVYKELGDYGRIGCAGCGGWETEYVTSCMSKHVWYDLIHMRQLYEQRTQEWSALKAQLENRSTSVHPQSFKL